VSKQSLLLVDGDTRSLRVLEVSLRKAGFSVTPAVSVGDALEKLEVSAPDLIISETKFATDLDGFELRRRLRATPDWAEIPFIFLTAETAIENKIKGLELGVDDYLTKPIYIKEIITRINILLQKRQRQFLDLRKDGTRFAGRVADMPVVDVIQTIEISRKSGVIQFSGGPNRQAAIYFRDGKVIDAEAGTLQGEDAVYRLLTWSDGEFEVEFRTVRRREVIAMSSQGLLMEGMRRLDEWSRLLEQLPPLTHRFEIDAAELATRLGEVPDDNNRILRLFDGKRTLLEVIDASDFGDLECLQAIARLYFEGLLLDLDHDRPARRDTSKPTAVVVPEEPQPWFEEIASGPIDLASLQVRASDASRPDTAALGVRDSNEDATMAHAIAGRAHRDSAEQISDTDVLGEEEEKVPGPLSGGLRVSSLRLIDEAVAAAQLIEPSLFEAEELAALEIEPAPTEEPPRSVAPVPAPPGPPPHETREAAIARVKLELRTADPRIENARDLVEKSPTLTSSDAPNGRSRRKTLPPPIPRAAAKAAAPPASEDPPLLDSNLLTSGEHKLPADDSEEVPLLDSNLLTSGEHKLPNDAEVAGAAVGAVVPESPQTPADSDSLPASSAEAEARELSAEPPIEPEDYSGVPTVIEAEKPELDDVEGGPTELIRRGPRPSAASLRRDESLEMISSHGRDRAEAAGELRPPAGSVDTNASQCELVTIMPRRRSDAPQVSSSDDVSTANLKPGAAAAMRDSAVAAAPAAEPSTDEAAPASPPKPAIEPPPHPPPPRRVPVEGGVVVASRGLGRGAQLAIVAASLVGGVALYSYFSNKRSRQQPSATVQQDAAVVAVTPTSDAPAFHGLGNDAGPAVAADAAVIAVAPSVDAAVIAVAPSVDAAVVAVAPSVDAAVVAVAPSGDAGIDKNKEAKLLFDKGHAALEDGDPDRALELLDQSLKLRRTAKTLLERARALQRLGRIDDAVTSINDALKINDSNPAAYEQKGMILWSAQRFSEARPALEMYLQLAPDGRKADTIRSMLDEPR
jgi:DNA-binding response OmpR family regulator